MTAQAAGLVFTHAHVFDPGWVPGPGQKWTDAPKARMRVTRVTAGTVFYRYDDDGTRGQWYLPRAVFAATYLTPKESPDA